MFIVRDLDTMNDIDTCRSYSNENNLLLALKKLGFDQDRFLTVCTRSGRYTAIFPVSNITDGHLGRYANQGFMTLG